MFPVGSVLQNTNNVNPSTYIAGTTWQLISSVALASEHIVGNGNVLGLTDGTQNFGFVTEAQYSGPATSVYGTAIGAATASANVGGNKSIGVPTKAQLGANPEYSGLIADTITVYMWERTA